MKALDELRYSLALWLFTSLLRLLNPNIRAGDVHQPSARMARAIGRHCAEELAIEQQRGYRAEQVSRALHVPPQAPPSVDA